MNTKLLLVLLMSAYSLTSLAQNARIYTGSGTFYQIYTTSRDWFYVADIRDNILSSNAKVAGRVTLINRLNYSDSNYSSKQYSSLHGDYISFRMIATPSPYGGPSEQFVFQSEQGGTSGFCAFVKAPKGLYIVDVQTDDIITVLDDNIQIGQDFGIVVEQYSNEGRPSFYIMNNGYVNIYHGFSNTNSIKSRSADESTSNKAYNMSGMEIDPSNERVFIQDGKVKMNTK